MHLPDIPLMTDIHLLVLIHGMWGNPTHLAHMEKTIRQVKGSTKSTDSDGPELAVLVAKANSDESTYDGIDWGGERVAQEVKHIFVWFSFMLSLTPTADLGRNQGVREPRKESRSFFDNGLQLGWSTCAIRHWVCATRSPLYTSALTWAL